MNIYKAGVTSGVVVAAALMGGSIANAQSGFYMNGNVQGGYFSDAGEEFGADITLGFGGIGAGSMPVGAEVNLEYYALGGGEASAVNYSVYYDSSFGRFSVGLPRTAMDDYLGGGLPFQSITYSVTYSSIFSSYSGFLALLTPTQVFDYGLRFDGKSGDLEYGISYLYAPAMAAGVTSAGARYTFADYYTLAAGIESIPIASNPGLQARLSADYGNSGWALAVARLVTGGGNTFYSANGFYDLSDIRIRAGVVGALLGGGRVYSIGAEYSFMENGYVGVEVIGGDGGMPPEYTVYAGWNFDIGGM